METKESIKVKTFRRIDCVEVGKDRFDLYVSEFLTKIGQKNIISISPINYQYVDMATRQVINDYGVLIAYRSDTDS